jgi:hypothetical protein
MWASGTEDADADERRGGRGGSASADGDGRVVGAGAAEVGGVAPEVAPGGAVGSGLRWSSADLHTVTIRSSSCSVLGRPALIAPARLRAHSSCNEVIRKGGKERLQRSTMEETLNRDL